MCFQQRLVPSCIHRTDQVVGHNEAPHHQVMTTGSWELDLVAYTVLPEPGPGEAVRVPCAWGVLCVIFGAVQALS